MDLNAYLKEKKALIDSFLESYFLAPFSPDALQKSMVYSLSAGGKRIRPVLCLASYEACGGNAREIIPYAAALELIHTYSLIHDDLPAMDNDDLRRGKPTNHKVFGEGMAILAGDALLTEAFSLLTREENKTAAITDKAVMQVIKEIAYASGVHGMVGGQAQDLLSEDEEPTVEVLSFIHMHKTAALIAASVSVGGILAQCSGKTFEQLTRYGERIGLAFQIVDDILDVEGETALLGKTAGSDEAKKKMTYPKLYGLEQSKEYAREVIQGALDSLSSFDQKADPLRAIAEYLLKRKN